MKQCENPIQGTVESVVFMDGPSPCVSPFFSSDTESGVCLESCWRFQVIIRCGTGTRKRLTYAVHPGFVFDGASIPRFFWRVIGHPLSARFMAPALAHDYLYAGERVRRGLADSVFRIGLAENGVGFFRRQMMYAAVRFFGGWVYAQHTLPGIIAARKIPCTCEILI